MDGKDLLVFMQDTSGNWQQTACDVECDIEVSANFLETTDPLNAFVIKRLPISSDWIISGTGLVDYTSVMSALQMQNMLLGNSQVMVKMTIGTVTYFGGGFFQSIKENAKVGNAISYSYQIVANGSLTVTT